MLETLRANIAPICAAVSSLALLVCIVYARKTNRDSDRIAASLQDALILAKEDALRGWNQAAVYRLEIQQRTDEGVFYRYPPPVPREPPPGFVPGYVAAVQTVMDEAKTQYDPTGKTHPVRVSRALQIFDDKTAEITRSGVSGDIQINDPRPDPAMVAQAEWDKIAHLNQNTPIEHTAKVLPQTVAEREQRILAFTTHRDDLDARIRQEATQEAIGAVSEEKRAELRAEGGDEALIAYVRPVVEQVLAKLRKEARTLGYTLARGEPIRNADFENMMRRGFGFEPRPAPPELRTTLTPRPSDD